ncbi:LUD domain-containing protein [Mycobacterium sp.]|jgi:L-lactate dehydrogenase complex protein LldG|uniref:LutC/YkgG family protein n=1 Tax=Mycobacterium sp. TaxID=1785 RepID=UPI00261183E5|nr:LUD domain-containing protein [Mycobacterium sp.]
MLASVRSALAGAPASPVEVPRDYERTPLLGRGDVERFARTVAEYRARVLRIDQSEIAATVASLVPGGQQVAVPAGLPRDWIKYVDTITDAPDNPLTAAQLDCAGAVVTGCALGIAATGTIVLDTGTTQGRRVMTLVPDHHVCVVFTDQIVDTVPQAFSALNPMQPLTFISGPSATSDIELNRVEGVHGPRVLDILIAMRPTSTD